MADVIEEPQSKAGASEPAVPGEGKRCDPLDKEGYRNQQCMPRGPENGDAEKNKQGMIAMTRPKNQS
jgi:hypothetical protein